MWVFILVISAALLILLRVFEDWCCDWLGYWLKPKAVREQERKERILRKVVASYWRQVGDHPNDWHQFLIDLLTEPGLYAEGKTISIGAYLSGFLDIAVIKSKRGGSDGDEEKSLLVSIAHDELPLSTYPVLRQIVAKGKSSVNNIERGRIGPIVFIAEPDVWDALHKVVSA